MQERRGPGRGYRFKIRNIRTKYSLHILFIISTVTILFTFLTLDLFQRGVEKISSSVERIAGEALYKQVERRAVTVVSNISQDLEGSLLSQDIKTIREILSRVGTYDDIAYVYVYDTEGKIIADGTEKDFSTVEVFSEYTGKKAQESGELILHRKEDILDASIPIYSHGERIGGVTIGFYLNTIKSEVSQQRETIAFMALKSSRETFAAITLASILLFLLGIFFALKTSQLFVRPIIRLTEATRDIGKGDLSIKVDIRTCDELEELADSFNQMTQDLHNRQLELETLHNSAKTLTSHLDIEFLLENSLNAAAQILKVSKGSIMLIDNGSLVVRRSFGWKREEIPRGKPFSIGEGIAGYVAKTKKSILANDANNHPLFQKERGRIWRGCKNLICVPMVHEGNLKGVINIQDRIDGKDFTKKDLDYAEIIASSSALSLVNIELIKREIEKTRMEEELKTVEAVRKTLIPREVPKVDGVEIDHFYEPASQTGGDWFGYIEDNILKRFVILIGDAAGHGVHSALVTAAVNSFVKTLDIIRTSLYNEHELIRHIKVSDLQPSPETVSVLDKAAEDPLSPGKILRLLNKIVLDIGRRDLAMTFFVSLLDLRSKRITFANAGHNQPYIYRRRASGNSAIPRRHNVGVLKSFGVRLGDEEDFHFEEKELQLETGDVLLFYTDGIVECENEEGEVFGDRRLAEILEESAELDVSGIKNRIVSGAYDFFGHHVRKDDIALIVLKIK